MENQTEVQPQPKSFDELVAEYLEAYNKWITEHTSLNPVASSEFVAFCRRSEGFHNYWAPELVIETHDKL